MRLRWFRAYTIVQCLLKIFKLKRAEFELWTASEGEKNKSLSDLGVHLRDVSTLPRVWSAERCTDHFEYPFPVRMLHRAGKDRSSSERTQNECKTYWRTHDTPECSFLTIDDGFISFLSIFQDTMNKEQTSKVSPSSSSNVPELSFRLHGDEIPLMNEFLLQIVQGTLDIQREIKRRRTPFTTHHFVFFQTMPLPISQRAFDQVNS